MHENVRETHLGWVPEDLKDDKQIEAWKNKKRHKTQPENDVFM